MNSPEPAQPRRLAVKLSSRSRAPSRGPKRPARKRRGVGLESFAFSGKLEVLSKLKSFQPQSKAWKALLKHYLRALGRPEASLSLIFCGGAESRRLNRIWRQKDKEGDVLSFPMEEKVPLGFRGMLGDLLLNVPYVKEHAGRFAPAFHEELAFLTLHGLLHLCGQHHDSPREEARMWRLTRKHFPPPRPLLNALKVSLINAH